MHAIVMSLTCAAVLLSGCSNASQSQDAIIASASQPSRGAAAAAAQLKAATLQTAGADRDAPSMAGQAAPSATASPPTTGGRLPPIQVPDNPFVITEVARFNEPWAMTFLPDGRLLVTEKPGKLKLLDIVSGTVGDITGVPSVAYRGQGGLGDVILHPQYASNHQIYISYAEEGSNDTRGAAVARATLNLSGNGGSLSNLQVIWRQVPKVGGDGHYSHRLAFDGNGKLFISSGERQKFTPAQDMQSNLGKIVRLEDDGRVPADNPFAAQGGVAAQVWTLGHRNVLGLAFDGQGRLWNNEMGPKGGDEFNLIAKGDNYGYPRVSNGDHYNGRPIPDHDTAPEYHAPAASWTPVISPSSLVFYSGRMFPQWQGRALIGGLSSQSLVVVKIDGERAREETRYHMGNRIREVEQGPDGAVWLLEDKAGARLLKLTPVR